MDFTLDETEQAVADLADRIFGDKVDMERLRAVEAAGDWFDHELWQALADAGLVGVSLGEGVGGGGQDLVAAGVEIGAHTRTHADLGTVHDEPSLYDEVVTAGRELEDALSVSLRYFAFPFGQHRHLNRRAFRLAAEAGYEGVVSAYGGYNFPGDDAFHLQRMGVDGPMVRLKNWTTLDPYKQWKIPRYEYRGRKRPVMIEGATHG